MPKQSTTLGVPHHHIKRMVVWYLVILVAATFAIWWLYGKDWTPGNSDVGAESIKSYSIGGEVKDISKSSFVIKVGWSQDGEMVYYERNINVTSETRVWAVTKKGTVPVLNSDPIIYIRKGDKVTVYGEGNPYNTETLTATKIDVQR